MGLKYLLLLRFGLVNLVAFALLGAAWAQGLVAKVINADVTNMVVLICVVFLIGLILAGYRLWKVSKQLNAAYNFDPKERLYSILLFVSQTSEISKVIVFIVLNQL